MSASEELFIGINSPEHDPAFRLVGGNVTRHRDREQRALSPPRSSKVEEKGNTSGSRESGKAGKESNGYGGGDSESDDENDHCKHRMGLSGGGVFDPQRRTQLRSVPEIPTSRPTTSIQRSHKIPSSEPPIAESPFQARYRRGTRQSVLREELNRGISMNITPNPDYFEVSRVLDLLGNTVNSRRELLEQQQLLLKTILSSKKSISTNLPRTSMSFWWLTHGLEEDINFPLAFTGLDAPGKHQQMAYPEKGEYQLFEVTEEDQETMNMARSFVPGSHVYRIWAKADYLSFHSRVEFISNNILEKAGWNRYGNQEHWWRYMLASDLKDGPLKVPKYLRDPDIAFKIRMDGTVIGIVDIMDRGWVDDDSLREEEPQIEEEKEESGNEGAGWGIVSLSQMALKIWNGFW